MQRLSSEHCPVEGESVKGMSGSPENLRSKKLMVMMTVADDRKVKTESLHTPSLSGCCWDRLGGLFGR